jgi:hypothetical protein
MFVLFYQIYLKMKFSYLLLLVTLSISATIGTPIAKDDWIPENFNPKSTTLLIMTHPLGDKQNERMIKYLDENYPFKYEIIAFRKNPETALDKKYDDLTKYPFLICWNVVTTNSGGNWGGDTFTNFYDRKEKKTYPQYRKSLNYGQIAYRPFFKELSKRYNN